jgi:hypothetical protein
VKDVVLEVERLFGEVDQGGPGHERVESGGQEPESGLPAMLGDAGFNRAVE